MYRLEGHRSTHPERTNFAEISGSAGGTEKERTYKRIKYTVKWISTVLLQQSSKGKNGTIQQPNTAPPTTSKEQNMKNHL